MSNESKTVRVHFAGYADLCVDPTANPTVLATAVARDIQYELTERWRPEEDDSSELADHIEEKPLVSVRAVLDNDQDFDAAPSSFEEAVRRGRALVEKYDDPHEMPADTVVDMIADLLCFAVSAGGANVDSVLTQAAEVYDEDRGA